MDGFLLSGAASNLIDQNIAEHNREYGFHAVDFNLDASQFNTITENTACHNHGHDAFDERTGPSYCEPDNNFCKKTSGF